MGGLMLPGGPILEGTPMRWAQGCREDGPEVRHWGLDRMRPTAACLRNPTPSQQPMPAAPILVFATPLHFRPVALGVAKSSSYQSVACIRSRRRQPNYMFGNQRVNTIRTPKLQMRIACNAAGETSASRCIAFILLLAESAVGEHQRRCVRNATGEKTRKNRNK